MKHSRHVRTFSFQEADDRALERSRARLSRVLPGATESETVRVALHLLAETPAAELETAARRLVRLKTGRPRSLTRLPVEVGRDVEEDEERIERLQLLEEIHRLEQLEGEGTSERLASLYSRLGMIPVGARVEKA